jgi:glycosyltransferase involved in cell wall biosynthesis
MRIGVLEWDISQMGGRHREMMFFADYLISKGHRVTLYSNFVSPTAGWNTRTFLNWFHFQHLHYEHCSLEFNLQRWMREIPREWHDLDVLLCSYGTWGHLQRLLPHTRVITWVIHPDQARPEPDVRVWTNSQTSLARLRSSPTWSNADIRVVPSPIDYGIFREHSKPKDERYIDAVVIGSMLPDKRLIEAFEVCQSIGCSSVFFCTTWPAASTENNEIRTRMVRMGVRYWMNVPSKEVARALGTAHVYLSMSVAESCSLAIYEAMNAGAVVVSRNVGSVVEQTGALGYVFEDPSRVGYMLEKALADSIVGCSMARGMLFDREVIGHVTDDELRR